MQEVNDEEGGVRMRPWDFIAMVVVVLPSFWRLDNLCVHNLYMYM